MDQASYTIAIIGAGPAGLMAAEVLSKAGLSVHIYDAKPTAARKFLMAGVGGMNITHSEPFERFISRYGDQQTWLNPILKHFSPNDIRQWMQSLGIESFVGSSGRVFPTEMKAAPLLRRWLQRLREQNVQFFMRHEWRGWNAQQQLVFTTPKGEITVPPYSATILALGGASWPQLGSTATWLPILAQHAIATTPLQADNCGFNVAWSDHFISKHSGQALKNTGFSCQTLTGYLQRLVSEAVISDYGIEGTGIYALSRHLQAQLQQNGKATLYLDLMPQLSEQQLIKKFAQTNTTLSTSNLLKKKTKLSATAIALLYERFSSEQLRDRKQLTQALKSLPIAITAAQPIELAISSAGGIQLNEFDATLMLKKLPNVYAIGEMLDWSAPTGGYLLSACLAMGHWVGTAIARANPH